MVVYKRNNLSGVVYETGIWIDVILFRAGDGAASFHSGNDHNADIYYRMPGAGVFSVLRLKMCLKKNMECCNGIFTGDFVEKILW